MLQAYQNGVTTMIRRLGLLCLCLYGTTCLARPLADADIVDITDRFTFCWGQDESIVRGEDGTLTYNATRLGGMVFSVGDEDWSGCSRVVFELAGPSPCGLQPLVQYAGAGNDVHYMDAGTTEAYVDLTPAKRGHVLRVVLQASQPATLAIRRVYKVMEPEYGEQRGQLRINELMQSNVDCMMDDLNDFPDSWVELYNSGPTPVNLTKYRLGLTPDAATAWQLPPMTTVEPGGFVVVCCDKAAQGLHTDFRLDSGNGGSVYLFFNGEADDAVVSLRKQPAPNIAYGRDTEEGSRWGYQYRPTPASANCGRLCDGILPDVVFSEPGRVFTADTTLQLRLSMPAGVPAGTVIRYTTDGSEPTEGSMAYTSPVTVDSTTTLRAKAFCEGWLSPRSTTQSYLFMGRETQLPVISLVTDPRYWYDDEIGILANNDATQRNDWRRPVNLEYFEAPGRRSSLNQLVETRVGGASSRRCVLKTLNIYANKRFGTKRLAYEFFPDQRPGITDFKSIILRNGGSDCYFLFIRDAVIQRTMATYTDLDWQAWRPAVVFKNGVYKGMLNIRERSQEDNIYTNYGGLEDIDMIENWHELKAGDWQEYRRFETFFQEEGHTMEEYGQWMDLTEFSNLMLMNLYFNNIDFPANNFVMWRPRSSGDGRWRFIAKDTDFGLGLNNTPADYPTLDYFYTPGYDPQFNWGANRAERTLLFRHMMDDADYRRHFTDRAAVYMGDFLNERGTHAVWDPMYELIRAELPYHREQMTGVTLPDYDVQLARAREWLSRRTDFFYQHLADFYGLGAPTPVVINTSLDAGLPDSLTVTVNGIPLSGATFDGKLFAGQDITLTATAGEGQNVVKGWDITQVNSDGTRTTTTAEGPHYAFTMSVCTSLSLQARVETSGITTMVASGTADKAAPQWFTLDGRRLAARPQRSGLYIHGGRKVLVK